MFHSRRRPGTDKRLCLGMPLLIVQTRPGAQAPPAKMELTALETNENCTSVDFINLN